MVSVDTMAKDGELDNKSIRIKKIKRVLMHIALQATLFLPALDGTIVSISLARIGSDFNEFTIAIWVANAYYLSFDAFLPLFSSLNDILGRKATLIIGICIFLAGSLLCGIASSMIMLIVFRAISGIGASGIYSAVYVVISEMATLDKRGNYYGIANAVYALASVFGPLVGGSFSDHLSWRWCFFINLPIGGVALLFLVFFYDSPFKANTGTDQLKRFDYAGTFFLLSSNILFLLALNFGSGIYPWTSAAVLVPLILSAVFLCVFVVIECKFAQEPIIPPRIFRNRSSVATLLIQFWMGVCTIAFVYYFPVYLQTIRGNTAMWSGIHLIPMQLASCISATMSGILITKTGLYRPGLWIGMLLLLCFMGFISLFNVTTPYYQIYMVTTSGGVGIGILFSATLISQQASCEPKDISIVTGLNHFALLIGGSIGIAIANSMLTSQLFVKLPPVIPSEYVQSIIQSPLFVHDILPQQYRNSVLQVFNDSLRVVWYIIIPLAALGLITSFFVKHYDLRAPSQNEANEIPNSMDQNDKKLDTVPLENTVYLPKYDERSIL